MIAEGNTKTVNYQLSTVNENDYSSQLAKRKYTSRDNASTMVVIKGLAITAGSTLIAFATRGRTAPTIFASSTVTAIARQITALMIRLISSLLPKLHLVRRSFDSGLSPCAQDDAGMGQFKITVNCQLSTVNSFYIRSTM